MKHSIVILLSVAVAISDAQLFLPQSSPDYSSQPQQHLQLAQPPATPPRNPYAHPSLIENSLRESQLPAELQKSSRFYSKPHIAAALAQESWFTNQEMPVLDREAEKIPRDMIYKLFKNAGYIKRR